MGATDRSGNDVAIENADMDSSVRLFLSDIPYDKWVPLQVSGRRPLARYKHAAEMINDKLYVVGGSRNGRYLSDIQVFDLRSSTWSEAKQSHDSSGGLESDAVGALPAIAGHSLVKWDNKLLVVAGYSKKLFDVVRVWSFDLETHKCASVQTFGKVPIARGGQSVTIIGSKLIMFGGEDNNRHLLNDLHILDLETMSWNAVETRQAGPAPRFDHSASAYADRYLFIFGGCSHSSFSNDLHILDLQTMDWSETQVQYEGVNPRAGHAGTTVGDNWYIVGGGDNKSGASETLKLNMSKLVWLVATSVSQRNPLASEGLSLCSTTLGGEKILVTFGGYNGKYYDEVFILKHKPSTSAPPRILKSSAAAAAAASVTAAYAFTAAETKNADSAKPKEKDLRDIEPESCSEDISIEISTLSMEKKLLESRINDIREDNMHLKGSLAELQSSHKALLMELESMQGQQEAEKSRCLKLESQIAEIQERLELRPSLEHELEILRHQISSSQMDFVDDKHKRQNSAVWKWMAGTT